MYALSAHNPRAIWRNLADEMTLPFPLDVEETDEVVTITANLPGVRKEDLAIEFKDNTLSISGEFSIERPEDVSYIIMERPTGKFNRTLRFRIPLEAAKAEANLKDGVLTLRLPKSEQAKPKSIHITAS